MSHILTSSSQISSLEGLRLDQVYSLPRVYNTIQEIPYPRGIYLLPPVYREGATEVNITQRRSEMPSASENAVPSKEATPRNADFSMVSSNVLQRQEALLKQLRKVRLEVDQLERTLRKDPSQKSQPSRSLLPISINTSTSSATSSNGLVDNLKKMSEDRHAMQELILVHGGNLLGRLIHLRGKLNNFLPGGATAGNETQKKRKVIVNSPRTRSAEKMQELVVLADPQHPPLSLFSAASMLSAKFAVATNTFVHSSVQKMPEHLRGFLDSAASTDSATNADFVLTLMWKEMKTPDTSLMIDASRQTVPILSEANIVRYILRLLNAKYDSPECLSDYAANEKWLNVASRQVVYGNSKERQSAMRLLNGHLGKSSFLTSSSGPTLVDIALLSALLQTQCSLVGNVKKWAVACRQSDLLQSANITFGSNC